MNLLLVLCGIVIAAALGIFAQKLFGIPKPSNYTYLSNSVDSWQAEQSREEASSKKNAQFVIIAIIIAFFVYCIGDYKSVSKIDEPKVQSLEEKTEALNQELRKNAKIEELENAKQPIQTEQIIQNQIVPVEETKPKPKQRLNAANKPVDKNGYLE